MLMQKEREDVVAYGKKLITMGLTQGTGGNISIADHEKKLFAISPSGMDYVVTEPEDVVVMDFDGNVVEGRRKPSSEHELHRIFYVNRDDVSAVVHAHSIFSTVLATLGEGLPASNYLIALAGFDVRCARYASFGTVELAENAFEAMKDRKAAFLANHGLITGSHDIMNAFNIALQIEECAKVYVIARAIGKPVILDGEEMSKMIDKFQTYGQRVAKKDMA